VASSYSGGTEETLSALEAAFSRRCPVAAITTGGALGAVASRAKLPALSFPGGGQPRAAVGYSVTLLAGLLERAGFLELTDAEVEAGAAASDAALRSWGPAVPTDANLAKQLAWSLLDRLPVVEASGFLAAVARRWKTQLNENAKTMAVWEELPEANHNTVVGHPNPDGLHDHQLVVFLAGSLDHPRNALRTELSQELLSDAGIAYQVVTARGSTRFEQAMELITLGDLVSAYLALLYGVDPTPVESIARLKLALAAAASEADETSLDDG
jgi:glucose/mannose-6-phosphate isomerase